MAKSNDPDAKRVVVEYDDGSTRELEKGAVWHFEKDESEPNAMRITAELINISAKELCLIVSGAIELGMRMGLFDETATEVANCAEGLDG